MKFSQRIGLKPISTVLQTQGMDEPLRNSLWNVLDVFIFGKNDFLYSRHGGTGDIDSFSKVLWFHYFKKPMDSRPGHPNEILDAIRRHFFGCQWYEVYEFLEFVLDQKGDQVEKVRSAVNVILERELAGFRYVAGAFVPVTSEKEVAAIEEAVKIGPFSGVSAHLRRAIDHLSRKQNPDYRNSIKESVSAVESLARELTGNPKATLGDALAEMEKSGKMHPALRKSLSALYGYTSDEQGIRHAMLDEPKLTAADAKFLLVACSAFINYMKEKA
jgi:hypothetical protein